MSQILAPTCDKGGQNPPDGIGPRPPAPKGSGGTCPICHRRHMTNEDRERGIRAGNITSYNVAKAEEGFLHWEHEQAMRQSPPEYAI